MHLLWKTLVAVVLSAAAVIAQPVVSYNSYEDYCRANPHAPTCKDGKPLDAQGDMEKMRKALTTNPMQDWCTKNPNEPVCRPTAKSSTPQMAVAPSSAVAPSQPVNQYQLVPPSANRFRKGPADVRLGELDWRLVLPESDFMLGLNLSDLLQSELARALIRAWAGQLGATAPEQDKLLAGLGDVSQTIFSVHQKEVLVTLIGRVDDFPEVNQSGPMQSVKVAPDTVLVGSNQTLYWTLFRLKFALNPSTAVKEAQQLAQSYQLWAWGKPAAFAAFGQTVPTASVAKVRFGLSLRDQFRMDMILDAASPAAAKRALEASSKAPRDMHVAVEGSAVHYTLALDRTVALERFGSLMSGPMGQQLAPLLAAARNMAAQKASPVRSSPSKVVIEGLDDGPRELSLPKP